MRNALLTFTLLLALPLASRAEAGAGAGGADSMARLVARIRSQDVHFVFVGEQHDVGPVKRFAVDLANALAASGADVGLYVEGFRTDCPPADGGCWSLARLFDPEAFATLLAQARVPVHAIDPPVRRDRVAAMAAAVAAGHESIRIVLAGRTHVVDAGDPRATLRVFGGGLRYADPGDLAEAFPNRERLTIGLETGGTPGPYGLRRDGHHFDYLLTTPAVATYWGIDEPTAGAPPLFTTGGGR
jgi:hypothetical protein